MQIDSTPSETIKHAGSHEQIALSKLIQQLSIPAFILGSNLKCVYANEALQRLSGYSNLELFGQYIHGDRLGRPFTARRVKCLRDKMLQKPNYSLVLSLINKKDEDIPIKCQLYSFSIPDLTVAALVLPTIVPMNRLSACASSVNVKLSDRELEILQAVLDGKSSAEIGMQLFLSPKTVDTYRSRLMSKLNVSNVVQLLTLAIRSGWVKI